MARRAYVKIKDNNRNWEKLKKSFKQAGNKYVVTGITNAAGGEVLTYANTNEFGATIKPRSYTVTNYKQLNKAGTGFNKKGRFVKKEKSNFAETFEASHNGYQIPSRPFMRHYFDNNIDNLTKFASKAFRKLLANPESMSVDQVLNAIGLYAQNGVKDSIRTAHSWAVPNAPSTIRQKGSDKPLIDHSIMINSVTYELRRG